MSIIMFYITYRYFKVENGGMTYLFSFAKDRGGGEGGVSFLRLSLTPCIKIHFIYRDLKVKLYEITSI